MDLLHLPAAVLITLLVWDAVEFVICVIGKVWSNWPNRKDD